MTAAEFESLIAKARKTNTYRDARDRRDNFDPPSVSESAHIRTAMAAIQAGVMTNDMNCIAEGYAMLESMAAFIEREKARRF